MEISSAALLFSANKTQTPTQAVRKYVHPLDICICSSDVPWFFWAPTPPPPRERESDEEEEEERL